MECRDEICRQKVESWRYQTMKKSRRYSFLRFDVSRST